jgi:ribosomal protein S18 acetylase RimI-like enzyme
MELIQATSEAEIQEARKLFEEYHVWLGLNLCFQNFDAELASLPGEYVPPHGRLFLATENERVAGCIALRNLGDCADQGVCEMKRLYVRPDFRGTGLGRQLAETLIEAAREIGYERMRLDTLPGKMDRAIAMYRRLGFKEIEPYYFNPVKGAAFMELDLGQRSEAGGPKAEVRGKG